LELFAIPLIFALVSAIAPRNQVRFVGLVGALASLVVSLAHLSYFDPNTYVSLFDPGMVTGFGLTFKMGYDGIGLFMVLLVNLIVPVILLANLNRDIANERSFNAMVMLMQFALIGVFTSMDAIMFYVFWEITLIPVFLIALWYGSDERKPVLIKFFIYTFVGSLGMLLSLFALGAYHTSFDHASLVALELSAKSAFWIMAGFFLAFAIKIPLFPFHTWQPSTYTLSPMAGTMLLSALMLKMALYGMVRWMIPLAPEAMNEMECLVITLGIIGVVYAGVIAVMQSDIKRLFAFASISHVGLIAAGIMLFNKDALSGAFVQIANHSLVAVGLFLAADILEKRLGTRQLREMGGVATLAPKFAFWFAVTAFASVSVPFTSGFIGEFLLIKGLYNYNWIVGLVAGTTLVFGAVYTLKAYQLSMFGAPAEGATFQDLTWNEKLAFGILTALIVVIGVYPQAVIDFVGPSLESMMGSLQVSNAVVK
jgi:NADH-quinone oxidoreductase subunit M